MRKQTLMAIGAHADDIELNVGGTLLKYHDRGYEIVYVMATNNFSGGWKKRQPDGSVVSTTPPHYEEEPQRKLEAAEAAKLFGTEPIHLDHPQRHFTREDGSKAELRYGCELPRGLGDDVPTIITAYEDKPSVKQLAGLILDKEPEAILTHGVAAGNVEHFATSLLVANAYWEAVEAGHRGLLLQWNELGIRVHGKFNFQWDTFVDISGFEQRKLEAIGKHACQMPFPERLDLPEMGPACGCQEAEVYNRIGGDLRPGPHDAFTLEIAGNTR